MCSVIMSAVDYVVLYTVDSGGIDQEDLLSVGGGLYNDYTVYSGCVCESFLCR